jgi:hypothetical protein
MGENPSVITTAVESAMLYQQQQQHKKTLKNLGKK